MISEAPPHLCLTPHFDAALFDATFPSFRRRHHICVWRHILAPHCLTSHFHLAPRHLDTHLETSCFFSTGFWPLKWHLVRGAVWNACFGLFWPLKWHLVRGAVWNACFGLFWHWNSKFKITNTTHPIMAAIPTKWVWGNLKFWIRWRAEIRLREKRLPKASALGNSVAGGNSAAGKASSPDHINVSSKKVFGGARKSATRNACTMYITIRWKSHTHPTNIETKVLTRAEWRTTRIALHSRRWSEDLRNWGGTALDLFALWVRLFIRKQTKIARTCAIQKHMLETIGNFSKYLKPQPPTPEKQCFFFKFCGALSEMLQGQKQAIDQQLEILRMCFCLRSREGNTWNKSLLNWKGFVKESGCYNPTPQKTNMNGWKKPPADMKKMYYFYSKTKWGDFPAIVMWSFSGRKSHFGGLKLWSQDC